MPIRPAPHANETLHNYLTIYPNPIDAQGRILLHFSPSRQHVAYQVKLWDMLGRIADTFQVSHSDNSLLLKQSIQAGIYIFALYDEQGNLLGTQQLMVQ